MNAYVYTYAQETMAWLQELPSVSLSDLPGTQTQVPWGMFSYLRAPYDSC